MKIAYKHLVKNIIGNPSMLNIKKTHRYFLC